MTGHLGGTFENRIYGSCIFKRCLPSKNADRWQMVLLTIVGACPKAVISNTSVPLSPSWGVGLEIRNVLATPPFPITFNYSFEIPSSKSYPGFLFLGDLAGA